MKKVTKVVLKSIYSEYTKAKLQYHFDDGTVQEKHFKFDSQALMDYKFADVINQPVHLRTYRAEDGSAYIDTKYFIERNNLQAFVCFDNFLVEL